MRYRVFFLSAFLLLGSMAVGAQSANGTAGAGAYKSADYDKAIDLLKKAVKDNRVDDASWYLLGSAYLKKNKVKDGIKAFEKAVKIQPKNHTYLIGLATAYLLMRSDKAEGVAREALAVNPKSAAAHYLLGNVALMQGSPKIAYERANQVIDLDPKYGPAYRLKGEALLSSFLGQSGSVIKRPENANELLAEAAVVFEKYVSLIEDEKEREEQKQDVESLKAFAAYFARKNTSEPHTKAVPDPGQVGLHISSKPRPSYTDNARSRHVTGTVILLVEFNADGRIGRIMTLKSLDRELDREAVKAAKVIKFTPASQNGVPITVIRQMEYGFSIY